MPGIDDMREYIAALQEDVAELKAGNARIEQQIATLLKNLPVLSRGLSDEDYRRRDAQQQTALKGQLQECPVLGECAVPASAQGKEN